MSFRNLTVFVILILVLAACSGGSNNSGPPDNDSAGEVTPSALPEQVMMERLSDEEFGALSEEEKYGVANKILGTLFKGVSPDDFFNLTNGLAALSLLDGQNYPAQIEADLLVGINETTYRNLVTRKYEFDTKQEPIQYQLALLYETPISRNYFEIWMAYHLSNTILFSPAVELDSVANDDARTVFERLLAMIREGSSIRDIVYAHMISQENWRRFRSPEDNTREMMEIFLRRFIDAEVPQASKACQNWSLTKEGKEYGLAVGDDANTDPVDILDTTVVECHDFYNAVSNHADLIPTIVSNIVNIFFAGTPEEDRQRITDDILEDGPETFNAIFTNIIFSKEYLISVERPKHYEELFFGLAHRIDWFAGNTFFKYLNRQSKSSTYPSLNNVKQAAMTYKLGREVDIPQDTLSFAYTHLGVRERLFRDYKNDPNNPKDGGWQQSLVSVDVAGDDFTDYLFLALLSRKASAMERETLNTVFNRRGYDRDDRKRHQAMIVMDYISRLSELYHTQPFE